MEKNTCPKFNKCPIFINNVFVKEKSGETYKALYCEAGSSKYTQCKRYIVSEKAGKAAPEKILPNCKLSVEEIIESMGIKLF